MSPGAALRRRRLAALAVLLGLAIGIWLLAGGMPGGGKSANNVRADRQGAQVVELEVTSKAVGRQLPVAVVLPAKTGDHRRPLLIFLHGRGANQTAFLRDRMFAALARLGRRAPVIAFPYGGDHSYWHDRDDGAWGSYVLREVIPQVTSRFKTDPRRVAIGGISMGGFGAYDLARLDPGRFCAVGGHSPAIWASSGETAPGAFDDAEDFTRHDVIGSARTQPTAWKGQPIWLDAGTSDPFRSGDEALVAALRAAGAQPTVKTWPGGHNQTYWDSHWADYLQFYADALRHC